MEMIENDDGIKRYPDIYDMSRSEILDDNYERLSVWDELLKMSVPHLKTMLRDLSIQVVLSQNKVLHEERARIAEYAGVDLKSEWSPDEEYFGKKRIKDLLALGNEFKFFEKENVKKFMRSSFNKLDPVKLKKKELVKVFLESKEDLTGMTPKEILDV